MIAWLPWRQMKTAFYLAWAVETVGGGDMSDISLWNVPGGRRMEQGSAQPHTGKETGCFSW